MSDPADSLNAGSRSAEPRSTDRSRSRRGVHEVSCPVCGTTWRGPNTVHGYWRTEAAQADHRCPGFKADALKQG